MNRAKIVSGAKRKYAKTATSNEAETRGNACWKAL